MIPTLDAAIKIMRAHRGHLLSQYRQATGEKKARRYRDWEALDAVLYHLVQLQEKEEKRIRDIIVAGPSVEMLIQFFDPTPGFEGWRATLSKHPWGDGRWYHVSIPVPPSILVDEPVIKGVVGAPVESTGQQAPRPAGMPERSYE